MNPFFRALTIITINGVAYFALCVIAFLVTAFFTGKDVPESGFLSVAPITLAMIASLPVAALHGLTIGSAIALRKGHFADRPYAGASILALFASLLTVFWWLFLSFYLNEDPGPSATARGAAAAVLLTLISFIANLATIFMIRRSRSPA